jgi:tetratricopeptide (TPR) repeat protein
MSVRNILFTFCLLFSSYVYSQATEVLINEAVKYEAIPNERQALIKYQEVLKVDPLNQTALIKCASLSNSIGAREANPASRDKYFSSAITYASNAYKHYPNSDESCTAMAIAYGRVALTKSGKEKVSSVREIKSYAEKALKINPNNFKAWHVLGKWHYEVSNLNFIEKAAIKLFFGSLPQSSFNIAIDAYEKARKIHPTFLLNYLELAKSYHKNNDKIKAVTMLKTLLSLPVKTEDDPRIKKEAGGFLKSWQ